MENIEESGITRLLAIVARCILLAGAKRTLLEGSGAWGDEKNTFCASGGYAGGPRYLTRVIGVPPDRIVFPNHLRSMGSSPVIPRGRLIF